jgi:MraZ protein
LVSNLAFFGAASLSLDAKGRVTLPARHRESMQAVGCNTLVITKHPDGCLMVFPEPNWVPFRDRIAALPMEAMAWKRVFLGSLSEVSFDSAARVLVDPVLRQFAGLNAGSKLMLMGLGAYFELWDEERYLVREAGTLTQPMPDSIRSFIA